MSDLLLIRCCKRSLQTFLETQNFVILDIYFIMNAFTYSSQPHSAPTKRPHNYPDEADVVEGVPLTMMSDPRVIRGNTHSLAKKIAKSKSAFSKSLNNTINYHRAVIADSKPVYTYEVKSFSNNEIDVSKYLIQQDACSVHVKDVDNQTNVFVERPNTVEYVPRKTGIDRSTQVEDVSELFNFDEEVVPILEVIVNKTIEQSIFELESEDELLCLEAAAHKFYAESESENKWMHNKEVEAIKESIATKVQIQALEIKKRKETAVMSLVAGVQMMRQLLPELYHAAVARIFESGVWIEPQMLVVRDNFVPQLLLAVEKNITAFHTAHTLVNGENAMLNLLCCSLHTFQNFLMTLKLCI